MVTEVAFRQLFCRADGCGAMFLICRPCYRGHAYCSEGCRQQTRQRQRLKANRRYEQDWEVRQDHRDRQRNCRERQHIVDVTDHTSATRGACGSMSGPLAEARKIPPAEKNAQDLPKPAWGERFRRIVCIICGRVGRFITAFTRRE
jgi:hypothetical protein